MAWGCDNVEWGGVEVRLQEPPPALIGAPPDTVDAEEVRVQEVPEGPVLYMAERDSTGIRLLPVAAIEDDSLVAFPSESAAPGYRARFVRAPLTPGSEFVLFSRGVRVGSFTAETVETDQSFCVARPAARGVVELIPQAADERRFLALARPQAQGHGWRPYVVPEMDREQRDATLSLPVDILAQLGADRPANFLDTRWDMQAFRPGGEDPAMFTVSHLFRDRMRIERPPPSAYSLFIVGVPGDGGYRPGLVWFRQVARQGKGAPRLFEQMDWNGDGEPDLLLEVLGEQHRWTAAATRRGNEWVLIHEDPCGAAAPPVAAGN